MVTSENYLPPPKTCETVKSIAARCGGSLEIRWDAVQVDYALPAHASEEVRDFLRAAASMRFAPESITRLPGGRVFGSGNVLSPDGDAIARDVSQDFGKAFDEHWLLTCKKIRRPRLLAGATAVIATTHGAGYAHWLLDELPRLLALRPGDGDVLIGHAAHAVNREAFGLLGWAGEVIQPARLSHFQCEQLVVPSVDGAPTPRAVERLVAFVEPLRDQVSPFGERIYVSRESARRRRVANEAELWPQLSARGFVNLKLEELTWREQINAFRHARIIVAPHGAGLANLVFCQPGAIVVELFNRSYVNGCFWQVAALRNLDYRPVVPLSPEPIAETLRCNRDDITVDVPQVLRALA